MIRTVDRELRDVEVVILDVTRVDDIDGAARGLLSGMSEVLRAQGKTGYLVDPDRIVDRSGDDRESTRFRTVDDAVAAAPMVRPC